MNKIIKQAILLIAGLLALSIIALVISGFGEPLAESLTQNLQDIMRFFRYGE